jgi:hypothetical protein
MILACHMIQTRINKEINYTENNHGQKQINNYIINQLE